MLMKSVFFSILLIFCCWHIAVGQTTRHVINLNGVWDFDQTKTSVQPTKFTRKIPVPGLVNMARPKVEQYDSLFSRVVNDGARQRLGPTKISPRYNWYRRSVFVANEMRGKNAVLILLKSRYVTQVYVNGRDMGYSIDCSTPIEINITSVLKYGGENEIIIKLGDYEWRPAAMPGGIDEERDTYMSGIWDDVSLVFTGNYRVDKILALPSLKNQKVNIKYKVWNFLPVRTGYGVALMDSLEAVITLREKKSGKEVAKKNMPIRMKGDNIMSFETALSIKDPRAWTPDDPFLYTAEIQLISKGVISDSYTRQFGMRDFERRGKYFYLNDKKIILRGANIGLHRFFCDPELERLPWDKEWTKKLLIDIPKKINWNTMRNTIGLFPDFWYNLADENGLLLQNEWEYWQGHGWDEQIRKEYTDWIWSDGSHPCIVIWDAMNEFKDDYIGNSLIPELKKIDPTRPWDNGFMEQQDLNVEDEIDEPHIYNHFLWLDDFETYTDKNPVRIGQLDFWTETPQQMANRAAAQIVNEYGWIWLWRNGMPSYLGHKFYTYYLGNFKNAQANRELQAYNLQWETELFRAHREVAGVLAFNYLSGNYGITGDWFVDDIKGLKPSPTLQWFKHCFAPVSVFIDLADQRYTKHLQPLQPDSELLFNLIGVNDVDTPANGNIYLYLLNSNGEKVLEQQSKITIPEYLTATVPVKINMPKQPGGYLLVSEFRRHDTDKPVLSRRYIKVGQLEKYNFYQLNPGEL